MAKLKPWFHVITPREDLREGRPLDASEFAVHLDHVREKRALKDYQEPECFFDRTYLTKNLRDLAAQTVRRLSGSRSRHPRSSTWRPNSAGVRRTLTLLFNTTAPS